ncbi:MAG: hypothetical protein PVH77_06480 [Phycisphaerales bacterium]|jgi:hypothetical protein
MELENRKPSGREKDEASIKLLKKLREQLYSSDASIRRKAAHKLSWMQEDGLDILKAALFDHYPVPTKNAAAYGLRKMQGRMKKMALEVLEGGVNDRNATTAEICRNALQLLGQKTPKKSTQKKPRTGKMRIKEISHKSKPRRRVDSRYTRR